MKRVILGLLLVCGSYLHAYQPYHATVTVAGTSATVSDPNLVNLSRSLRSESIQALLPLYTPTSAVSININLRGVDAITSFAANSTTLTVVIPQTNSVESFTGGTRDESLALFRDYIRDGGNKHRILRAYSRYSPIDPLAGNPNSILAQMAQADYALGRLTPFTGCGCWDSQPKTHLFQAGVVGGRAFSELFDTTIVTAPLRYSYSPTRTWAFIIDAPLSYLRNGGASSMNGSLGAALRLPITHRWSLTSAIRLGTGGSLDLCTSGNFFSTGLTSAYNYKLCDYVLAMTNYAGYFTSTNLWLTGVNFNYHLHNGIFRNGVSLNSCKGFTLCGRQINFGFTFVDTCFAGDSLYMNHYDEVGVSLITTRVNPYICDDTLSFGFTFQYGERSYKGYYLNAIYQF